MRKTLAWLAFVAPCACGGRTLGDWPEQAMGGGGLASGSGGSVPFASTGSVAAGSGGRSSGGATNQSGAPSSGGVAAGGLGSGGYTGGGPSSGGSGGREPCFEVTQPGKDICIHVRLCSVAQYETLCLMETPTSAVCFCYVDGTVKSATSILSATVDMLCGPAVAAQCP